MESKRTEYRRRKREGILIFVVAILFALLTYLQVYLAGLSQKLPFINSILFFALMNLNVILLGLLIFLVFRNVVKLFWERKNNVLGSKLKTKLVVVFVGFTLIPTALLFTVSAFYINNSFGKWFSSQLTNSLQHALDVHNFYYQDLRERGFTLGEKISHEISKRQLFAKKNLNELREAINVFQKEYALDTIEFFQDLEEEAVSAYGPDMRSEVGFPSLEESFLKEGLAGRQASKIQSFSGGDLVRYRLQRARETLEDARILANSSRWNPCVNRLYYACFYAVSALLIRHGLSSSKHTGVRSLFNRHYVRTGVVPKELAQLYNDQQFPLTALHPLPSMSTERSVAV